LKGPSLDRRPGHCFLLGVLLSFLACGADGGGPRPGLYPGVGDVLEVDEELGQVVIAHEDIPGLMPAMTMNFDVESALFETLAPGQRISFQLSYTGRGYRVVEAEVIGTGGSRGARLGLAAAAREDQQAPGFALVDQDGQPLSLADLRGKVLLIDFVYTHCPGPCPILTGLHVQVQKALPAAARERVRFVSISLDPGRDRPETMRAYAEARGVDFAGWSFLTGEVPAVQVVLDAYGVGRVPAENGEIDHLVVTFLVDPEGIILKRYMGLEHDPQEMVRDLERAAS